MGFMDKAKKMAEQAQAKLDDAQKQFNSGQQSAQTSDPAVEYDKHGRPIQQAAPQDDPVPAESSAPPHGDPVAGPPSPAAPAPAAEPPATPTPPPAAAPPGAPDGVAEDRNHPSYAPPKLSSGDPLAG
jgi:hypothetical protein